MNRTVEEIVEKCTAKIKVVFAVNKIDYGTGFFIAPSIILTCAHVVKNAVNKEVLFSVDSGETYEPARVIHYFEDGIDIALLQSNQRAKGFCVYVGNKIQLGDPCFIFGYSDPKEGHPEGDPVTLECEGLAGSKSKIIKLKGSRILHGMSGSPLLNRETGQVCGVVTRSLNVRTNLGGEALPLGIVFDKFPNLKQLHDEFHQTYTNWSDLLVEDIEPFASDWKYLDRTRDKWCSYIKALIFLIIVLVKWLILGFKAPKAFPVKIINELIKHTFTGDLGQEINKQRKELTRKLELEIDRSATGQAQIINQLESQAIVLSKLINLLIPEAQNLASSSRLLWAVELIYEQQDLLNDLKQLDGNSYPALEKNRKRYQILRADSDPTKYRKVDRITGRLLFHYFDFNLSFLFLSKLIISDIVDLILTKPNLGISWGGKVLDYLNYRFNSIEEAFMKNEVSNQDNYTVLVQSVFEELDCYIKENPQLKVLSKTKLLLENVAGKPVTGGPYRAWGKGKTYRYHFSRKCKLYPERARPNEMDRIVCYDTHEEAKKKHSPCTNCMNAENVDSMDFIGEEPPDLS